MNDDIMTDNCAAVRTLSMVRCERVVHYVRSISDYAADSEDARVSMTAFTRLGICTLRREYRCQPARRQI